MPGPLQGLRVIDCSRGMAGTKLTGILADHGADVIWVEPPGGDPWRERLAVAYSVHNRNKRSIVLDLKQDQGIAALRELLKTADVLVQSWRPGTAERLGLGYDTVHTWVPGLVYCSITGFGTTGENADLPGYEALVHAYSGAMGSQTSHSAGPTFIGLPKASNGAAYLGVTGILAALHARQTTGSGHHVETSLLDGIIAYMRMYWGRTAAEPDGYQMLATRRMIARSYRCADDEYLGLSTMSRGGFDRFIQALGLQDRIPPAGGLEVPLTQEQGDVIVNEIPKLLETRPRPVWLDRLIEADLAVMPYLRPGQIFDERPVKHNELVAEVDDLRYGRCEQVAPPVKFARTPAQVRAPAPSPGLHTDEVLGELSASTREPHPAPRPTAGNKVLDGVKIVDFGHWYASPYTCRILADLGADVICVEPVEGDPMRPYERAFSGANVGKRSITLNLKTEDGRRIAHKLVGWADVVAHNLRVGAAEPLGLGTDEIRAINPRVILLQCSGWGQTGADAPRQSLAPMMSAYTGQAYEVGGKHMPPIPPMAHEDSTAGMIGAYTILMALRHRDRTGQGQTCDLSILAAAMLDIAHIVRQADGTVLGSAEVDSLQLGTGPLERLYETADGWICVVACTDAQLRGLGTVIGNDILADERFTTEASRRAHAYALERLIADALLTRTCDELIDVLRAEGVPAVLPRPGNPVEMLDSRVNLRAGRAIETDIPGLGRVQEYGSLVRIDGSVPMGPRRPPRLGEHNAEILDLLSTQPDAPVRPSASLR